MAYSVTVDAPLADGEPTDFPDLWHAMFDAANTALKTEDSSLGAITSFDDEHLQVVLVVEAGSADDAGHAARQLVTGVLANEGLEVAGTIEIHQIIEGRDAFDELSETFER